ncbi:MAG: PLP-dependent aspartate aminotransferase family protein, partial [Pseudomonadota bacterium]
LCDTPAIAALARSRNIITVLDNTWGCGAVHRPLELGVDISVQALTKYVVGHADAFGGAVLCRDKSIAAKITATAIDWGLSLAPDDAWLAVRGLRTLPVRLKAHEASATRIAGWLETQKGVARVLHPGLESHPDHAIWQRDFSGATGLFGLVLEDAGPDGLQRFFGALSLFGFGFSWGGYESLAIPADPKFKRETGHPIEGDRDRLIRVHIGLEDTDDLIADLSAGLMALGD